MNISTTLANLIHCVFAQQEVCINKNSKTRWDNIIVALQIFMIQHYCTFYTLAAEYGSVVCDGVPMADIPAELQDSRVFKLHLRSNSLHRFPDSKLEGTGKLK